MSNLARLQKVKENVPFDLRVSLEDNSLLENYLIDFGQEEHSP